MMMSKNHNDRIQHPLMDDDQFLNYLAIWVLEVCYQELEPTQQEIDRVEEELRKIHELHESLSD